MTAFPRRIPSLTELYQKAIDMMKVLRVFIMAVIVAPLLFCACIKEESDGVGYLEYKNETSLTCTVKVYGGVGKDDLFTLQIPAGETGIYYGEIYYMGSFVMKQYRYASLEFSDGSGIVYNWGGSRLAPVELVGNLLMENSYTVRKSDGKYHLLARISEGMHDVAVGNSLLMSNL